MCWKFLSEEAHSQQTDMTDYNVWLDVYFLNAYTILYIHVLMHMPKDVVIT